MSAERVAVDVGHLVTTRVREPGRIAELAAARRGETVAHVIAAIEPSDSQRERIAGVLGRIYGREISTQVEVDPDLLGGLRVAIGDEVIDADVATKLTRAASDLPS